MVLSSAMAVHDAFKYSKFTNGIVSMALIFELNKLKTRKADSHFVDNASMDDLSKFN